MATRKRSPRGRRRKNSPLTDDALKLALWRLAGLSAAHTRGLRRGLEDELATTTLHAVVNALNALYEKRSEEYQRYAIVEVSRALRRIYSEVRRTHRRARKKKAKASPKSRNVSYGTTTPMNESEYLAELWRALSPWFLDLTPAEVRKHAFLSSVAITKQGGPADAARRVAAVLFDRTGRTRHIGKANRGRSIATWLRKHRGVGFDPSDTAGAFYGRKPRIPPAVAFAVRSVGGSEQAVKAVLDDVARRHLRNVIAS
jgi:hypothetical protein